jgi:hypothetical protein
MLIVVEGARLLKNANAFSRAWAFSRRKSVSCGKSEAKRDPAGVFAVEALGPPVESECL